MWGRKKFHPFLYIVVFVISTLYFSITVGAADSVPVSITGYFDYQCIDNVLAEANKVRAQVGAPPLELDAELTKAAMQRAAETQLIFDHTRPNGSSWSTISDRVNNENITTGEFSAAEAVQEWKKSERHYQTLIDPQYVSTGIGCFYQNDVPFWVQLFSTQPAKTGTLPSGKQKKTVDIELKTSYFTYYTKVFCSGSEVKRSLTAGKTANLQLRFFCDDLDKGTFVYDTGKLPVLNWTYVKVSSADRKVISCQSNGQITAVKPGHTTLTVQHQSRPDAKLSLIFEVTKNNAARTVKLNANGGSFQKNKVVSSKTISVTYNKGYGQLAKPVRKGYTFSGWYTAKTGGKKIIASSIVRISKNATQTLYARWTKTVAPSTAVQYKPTSKSTGRLTASWRKISGVTGYEVSVCTLSRFSGSTLKKTYVTGASKTTYTFSNLKQNKKYFVRVRAYRTDSCGNKIYGKYSTVKTVTVHK